MVRVMIGWALGDRIEVSYFGCVEVKIVTAWEEHHDFLVRSTTSTRIAVILYTTFWRA